MIQYQQQYKNVKNNIQTKYNQMSSFSESSKPGFVINTDKINTTDVVLTAKIYDCKAANPALNLINGRHCYAILYIIDLANASDKMVRVEAGKNAEGKIEVKYEQISQQELNNPGVFITSITLSTANMFPFFEIIRLLNVGLEGVKYSLAGMNCYGVCQLILKILKDQEGANKVAKRYQQVAKGSGNTVGDAVNIGIGFAIGGPVGAVVAFGVGKLLNKIF